MIWYVYTGYIRRRAVEGEGPLHWGWGWLRYTSGSTGTPKGVLVPQRSVLKPSCKVRFHGHGWVARRNYSYLWQLPLIREYTWYTCKVLPDFCQTLTQFPAFPIIWWHFKRRVGRTQVFQHASVFEGNPGKFKERCYEGILMGNIGENIN